jgi:hypothetical protein
MRIFGVFIAVLAFVPIAHADDAKAFWQKGAATTITGKVQETSSERIAFRDYPIVVDRLKQLQKHEEEARSIMQKARFMAEAQKAEQRAQQQFAQPQQPPAAAGQASQQAPASQEQPNDQFQAPKALTRDEIVKK